MSEGRVPTPDFNESNYDRPSKDWVCGHTCDGCPCRIGPSPAGECRATTECKPQLVVKKGEAKGTWKCARPKEWGGPCETGPLPDGTCCRAIPKCQPVRSLRAKRGLVTRVVVLVSIGLLFMGLGGPLREAFINPAPLSSHHTGPAFDRLAAKFGASDCAACHAEVRLSYAAVVASAFAAGKTSLPFGKFVSPHPKDFSRMDRSCMACHADKSFHEAAVVDAVSCSVCHREHQGAGSLASVSESHCTTCHGDAAQMLASSKKGGALSAALFERKTEPGLVIHPATRPSEGFTRVIGSFATDHPEFQVLREKHADANTLKFNHRTHLTGDIPRLNGKPLACADCHRPDASGAFMQRLTFEQNCRVCHALNFDENTPGMQLPHGDAVYARAYLRSLPTQYADYATRTLGITGKDEVAAFVQTRMTDLRQRTLTGENLERAVFFADARTGEATIIAGVKGLARAKFAGCAYCHEVTPRGDATPVITPPQTPDRWMMHSKFDHSKHTAMSCTDCHAAAKSAATADVIMPSVKSCATCHSPKGGVANACVTCHGYHNPKPPALSSPSTAAHPLE
ncbi:MAG: cytochrome c3 family protein [Opitutaceae bacterium]|jgi:hypothetical protein